MHAFSLGFVALKFVKGFVDKKPGFRLPISQQNSKFLLKN